MAEAVLMLEERLDLGSASDLASAILEHVGKDLTLDASGVNHFGAIGVQVIRAAAKSWDTSGKKLEITGLSNDCSDQVLLLGFTAENLCIWGEGE